jgi:hypothetical protein
LHNHREVISFISEITGLNDRVIFYLLIKVDLDALKNQAAERKDREEMERQREEAFGMCQ